MDLISLVLVAAFAMNSGDPTQPAPELRSTIIDAGNSLVTDPPPPPPEPDARAFIVDLG